MPNELKACPWCGSKVTKMTDADRVSAMRDYYCPGCKVSVTWFQTEVGQTDDLWNTRPAAPVPTAGGVEALREALEFVRHEAKMAVSPAFKRDDEITLARFQECGKVASEALTTLPAPSPNKENQ